MADLLEIGRTALRVSTLAHAARSGCQVRLHPAAWSRIAAGHAALERAANDGTAIYGVSTGLGAVVDTRIAGGAEVQRRVVLARMVGVGPLAMPDQVRAVMLARLAGFAEGRSGVSPDIAAAYLAMLNAGIVPAMPLVGSVGEADLAPLAHIAGVLAGDGAATLDGETMTGPAALAQAGLAAPQFGVKDGLALVSSNAAAVGLASLIAADAVRLVGAWLAAAALGFEAYRANLAPLEPAASALRPAPGQGDIAATLLAQFTGGALMRPGAARRLQDPLSFRCIAPVLGACLAALRGAIAAVGLELNSSDDNPAILAETAAVQPNANFDPTHLVLAFETLGLAMSRVAAAQGARIVKLMSAESSGLPRFLSPMPAGRSGFATAQKTAGALVAEIGQHALPMPAWIIPAADGVEDYATMAVTVMRKSAALLGQMRLLCALELMVAAQGCDLRGAALGSGAAAALDAVRTVVPALEEDRPSGPDVTALDRLIGSGAFDQFGTGLFAGAW